MSELKSYGRLDAADAEIWEPNDVPELAALLKRAIAEERRVTLRAAGNSFHDQALNEDVVISLLKLNRIIAIDEVRQTVVVEPAATWGDIVDAVSVHELVPYVVVTTTSATAGGTLSSDGISRHSPSYGSESVHVEYVDLLEPGADEPRRVYRPGPTTSAEDVELFRAIIGGFGYLGAITQICYRLLSVRGLERSGRLQVATRLTAVESFDELVNAQLMQTCIDCDALGEQLEARLFDPIANEKAPALYAVSFMHEGNGRGAVYRSWYTRGHGARPYLVFLPHNWLRILLGLLASVTWIRRIGRNIAWWLIQRDARAEITFINDAVDFLFFMDANVTKKRIGERLGWSMPTIQQTFVLPTGRASAFLDAVPERMAAAHIMPTLIDVLFMPEDRILMSASCNMQGFACTLSFEDIRDTARRDTVIRELEDLSELCLDMGGKVHLTKNVYVRESTLEAMYGAQVAQFMAIKRRLDPHHVLRNAFFERTFAAAVDPGYK